MKKTRITVIALALAITAYTLFPAVVHIWANNEIDNEVLNTDFETGDLRGWTKTGNSFDYQPTLGDNPKARNRENSNHQGKWWIGGYEKYQGKPGQEPGNVNGDGPTGTLTSNPFTIHRDRIYFLIGGGKHPWVEPDGAGSTCVNLLVSGRVVRTATGSDYETMSGHIWNVSELKGKTAVIQIVDKNTGTWGHINFDHISQMTRWQAQMTRWQAKKANFALYLWAGITLLLIVLERRGCHTVVRYTWRSILALTGLLILALSAPHASSWSMKYIQSSLGENTLIHVKFFQSEIVFSAGALWKSLALLFAGMILVIPSARGRIKSLIHQPRRLVILLLSLGYLLFSLKPSQQGWGMVLYLILGAVGITMTFIGVSPLVDALIRRLRGLGSGIGRWFYGMPAWMLIASLFAIAFTATNLGTYFLFDHVPHVSDSINQVFHGKIFLLGRLTVPSPEPREFFDVVHMINNGKWYSQYPPGHSLLMSFGHILHATWIINPLFGSLCIVLLYFIGKEIYGDRIGRLAALLGVLSPFLIFMASGFMNHTTTLFFVELFLLGFARMVKRSRARDAILVGFALGYALNIRPLTAVAIGAPFAIYAIFKLIRSAITSREELLRFGMLCFVAIAAFGVMLGGFLMFNYITNGEPLISGYVVLHGKEHNPGFGLRGYREWGGVQHTPRKGLIQTIRDLNALNKYLFEIPIPSLLFAVLALASLKANVWDLLLIGYVSSLVFAYFCYWTQSMCFGPRFIFESTAAFVLLTARGITDLPRIARDLFGITDKRRVKGYIAIVIILCFCLGFASNIPPLVKIYSSSYWDVNGQEVLRAVKKMRIKNAVVFVKNSMGYNGVFPKNHPLLNSDVIYAKYLGEEKNAELMRKFPGRKFYIANGPSIIEYPGIFQNR